MITMTLTQVANALNTTLGSASSRSEETISACVHTDSRLVSSGDIFFALVGEHTDGHNYIDSASRRGASVIVVDKPISFLLENEIIARDETGGPVAVSSGTVLLQVDDCQKALGDLARAHLAYLRDLSSRQEGALRAVIGITGSAGKTTTKDLCGALLATAGQTVAPKGSFNNEVGLPLTVLQAKKDTVFLVLEMGASAPGDLQYLTRIAPLDIAVVLMVGSAHLESYTSVDDLAKEKSQIIAGLSPAGVAILNADDPRVLAMSGRSSGRLLEFSTKVPTNVWASNIRLDEDSRARFILHTSSGQAPVSLQLIGAHHVHNALAAAACAATVGVNINTIAQVLSQATARSAHRMHMIKLADGVDLIDDAYNANPDSMNAALQVLSKYGQNRRTVAVLGDMLELGQTSAQLHGQVGREAARSKIDVLVGVGPRSAQMVDAFSALCRLAESHHCLDAKSAFKLLREIVHPGDLILIKGSHGCGLWEIAQQIGEKGRIR